MRSFWICCVAASLLAGGPAAGGQRRAEHSRDELINVFVSPRYAQWLVGPVARLASTEEIESFLAIVDDDEAERFIDEFWAQRPPVPGVPGLTSRQQFEQRAEEADRMFTEAAFPGRRSDRGTIHVLYGPPDDIEYKEARRARDGLVEVWYYHSDHSPGLDGETPARSYHFVKDADLTRFARPSEMPRLIPLGREP